MKHYFLFLFIVFGFLSCGNKDILHIERATEDINKKPVFFISTNEDLLDKHNVLQEVNLIDLFPEIESFEIKKENFWKINDALEVLALNMRSNYAVLLKGESCLYKIGYCKAAIIDKYIEK